MPAPTLVAGAPCWIDIYSSDTRKATEFYSQLFGWTAEPPEERFGGYFTFTKDGKHVGGCMHNDGAQGVPDVWTVYLLTDDIEATAEAAAANGGQIHLSPMAVADNGQHGDDRRPRPGVGGRVAARQPEGVRGARGDRHTELVRAPHAGLRRHRPFYRDVFKWDTHVAGDTPEFRYTTLGEGEDQLAGIMDASAFLPEGSRPTGRSTSVSRTRTRRWRGSSSSAGRSSGRRRTHRTAASRRPPTRQGRRSSSSPTPEVPPGGVETGRPGDWVRRVWRKHAGVLSGGLASVGQRFFEEASWLARMISSATAPSVTFGGRASPQGVGSGGGQAARSGS